MYNGNNKHRPKEERLTLSFVLAEDKDSKDSGDFEVYEVISRNNCCLFTSY